MKASPTVSDLVFAEQFLVWASRVWVQTGEGNTNLEYLLQDALKKVGVSNAYCDLDTVMTILYYSSILPRQIGCPNGACKNFQQLWSIEKLLLSAISDLQSSDTISSVENKLHEYMTPAGLRLISKPLRSLSISLLNANLKIPFRDWDLENNTVLPIKTDDIGGNRVFH